MGHIRLGKLPASRKWRQVVALIAGGAGSGTIAAAAADASKSSLRDAHADPALIQSFWLLTQIPLAARTGNFTGALRKLGVLVRGQPTLLELSAALSDAVDRAARLKGGRTDLGEMAQLAAVESLAEVAGRDLPGLFGPTPVDVRLAIGKLAAPDRFAKLARDFFARLTRSHLDYFLSRALPDHVGHGRPLSSVDEHSHFNSALELHCFEASKIVEQFAGGWFSKSNFEGGISPTQARNFSFVALKKIGDELQARTDDDA